MKAKIVTLGLAALAMTQLIIAQNLEWAKSMGGFNNNAGQSIAVDNNGNVFTTGYFQGTADFDPGPNTYNLTSAGESDVFVLKLDNSGNFIWAIQLGSWYETDRGISVAAGTSGDVYVTGIFFGSVDFDPGPGTFNLTSTGSWDTFILKLDAAGNFIWAKRIGGLQFTSVYHLAIDTSENIYLTGFFKETIDFAGLPILTSYLTGGGDAFVLKLNSNGGLIWAKQFGGAGTTIGTSIKSDQSGSVYVSGIFSGTVDFNPDPAISAVFNYTSFGVGDGFITKLDINGDLMWALQIGGTAGDGVNSISLDASGNAYAVGWFQGICDFNPSAGSFNLTADGDDIFVAKYNSLGIFQWAKKMGGVGSDRGHSIYLDASGNIYTTGFFQGSAQFDPGTTSFILSASGSNNTAAFISKLDSSGSFLWAGKLGGNGETSSNSIFVDASANIYTTGLFGGTDDFDPNNTSLNLTSSGLSDIFIVKLGQTLTSISEFNSDVKFTAYPNPTHRELLIDLGDEYQAIHIAVKNAQGQDIKREYISAGRQIPIFIDGPTGVYFIETITNHRKVTFKVIKH